MSVKIENLSFSYPDAPDKLILNDLSLEMLDGDFVCVLGQSGCGKSTLLRLIAGLEMPSSGSIEIDGKAVEDAGLDRAVVFQDYGLFPWMTAGENIVLALGQRFPEKEKSELEAIAIAMLENVDLDASTFKKLPKELSGGMKQRCAIAQAFSIDSPILLMDEPFGALDAVTRARLQDLVISLWQNAEEKKTVLFVTHDVDEALLLANHIVVLGLSPSRIIYECRIAEEDRSTREDQYSNPKTMELRTELIQCINADIAKKITDEG